MVRARTGATTAPPRRRRRPTTVDEDEKLDLNEGTRRKY